MNKFNFFFFDNSQFQVIKKQYEKRINKNKKNFFLNKYNMLLFIYFLFKIISNQARCSASLHNNTYYKIIVRLQDYIRLI